jgi:hypothetical protein
MLISDKITWKNIYLLLFYITITSLELGYIYLLIKYLKNEKGYKIHKLDICTLFSTLIIFTTYVIQSYLQTEYILIDIINIFTEFALNTIICSIILVTLSNIFTENINITNYTISIIVLVVIFSIIDILINNVHSLTNENRGRNIKILIFFIEIFFGLITIIISIINGFSNKVEDNLILIVNEEDIYIRHLSASMIRRVKELSKTYIIFVTSLFISTVIDIYLIFVYKSELFFIYMQEINVFTFDEFFSYSILFFIKDLLPYLTIVIATLIYRWK